MDWLAVPLLSAQAAGSSGGGAGASTSAGNPAALASLAFRRWCSGLTLSSPDVVPGLDGLWAFLSSLALLLVIAAVSAGPLATLKQLIDIPGHARAGAPGYAKGLVRGASCIGSHHFYGARLDG